MIRKRKTYNQIILVMGIVIALLIAALIFALSTRGAGAGNTPAELTVYDDPNDALPPVRFNAGMVEYEAEGGAWLPLTSLEALFAALLFAMPLVYPLFSLLLGRTFPMITSPVMPCSVAVFAPRHMRAPLMSTPM